MSNRIAFVHTSATLVPLFQSLAEEKLPGQPVIHISDDSLIKDVIECGEVTPGIAQRVANLVQQAEAARATHIMFTCSSIGEAVEAAAKAAPVPVMRVDQAMASKAVQSAQRIGVIATLPTTLEPTRRLVENTAALMEKAVEIKAHLCQGAFEALMSGDSDTHDSRVREGLRALMDDVDVIVLAQASMARVVETIPVHERTIPILSSPGLAVEELAERLN